MYKFIFELKQAFLADRNEILFSLVYSYNWPRILARSVLKKDKELENYFCT